MPPIDVTICVVQESQPSDEALLAAVGRGDMHALQQLVVRHQDKVVRLACRMLGDVDLSQDIAQEAFIRVHHHAGRFDPRAKFTTWLYRITANLCIDQRRRSRHHAAPLNEAITEADDRAADPSQRLQDAELAAQVQQAVASLPERQQMALLLHRYEGLSHQQVAEAMDASVSSVESLLVRAYATLRKKLERLGPTTAGNPPDSRLNE